MRLAIWAPLLITPLLAAGCAAQNSETDRQVKELQARIKQLSAKSDQLEDRLAALELAYRANNGTDSATTTSPTRPDLPTIKVNPPESAGDVAHEPEQTSDNSADDSKRLMIIGEGSRIETRTANDASAPTSAATTNRGSSRSSKRSPSNVPATSTGGAPQ